MAKFTQGKRHRRRWLILGGHDPVAAGLEFWPRAIFAPAWVGVALGLVLNPGEVFQLENVAPFVLYFGGGTAVTALLLHFAGVRGNAVPPAAVRKGVSPDNAMTADEE